MDWLQLVYLLLFGFIFVIFYYAVADRGISKDIGRACNQFCSKIRKCSLQQGGHAFLAISYKGRDKSKVKYYCSQSVEQFAIENS